MPTPDPETSSTQRSFTPVSVAAIAALGFFLKKFSYLQFLCKSWCFPLILSTCARMPSRRWNYHFAPRCPINEDRRKEWERSLHHADKELDESWASSWITFRTSIYNPLLRSCNRGHPSVHIPRGKPPLSENAVPTILPNLPRYLWETTLKPRNKKHVMKNGATNSNKNSRNRLSCDPPESPPATHADKATKGATISQESHCSLEPLLHLKTHSKYWAIHYLLTRSALLYIGIV